MKKKRTWTALILIAALILIFAAPANCEAEDARILLMRWGATSKTDQAFVLKLSC